jgi:3-hydroxyisobutyryl-CoA hydrolase
LLGSRAVGIATHFIPSARLPYVIEQLSTLTNNSSREAVDEVLREAENDPSEREPAAILHHAATIERVFRGKTVEAVVQNLENDGTDFSKNALKLMKKASPTSLKVCDLFGH